MDKYRVLHPNYNIFKKIPRLGQAFMDDDHKFLDKFYERYITFDLNLKYSLEETEKEFDM